MGELINKIIWFVKNVELFFMLFLFKWRRLGFTRKKGRFSGPFSLFVMASNVVILFFTYLLWYTRMFMPLLITIVTLRSFLFLSFYLYFCNATYILFPGSTKSMYFLLQLLVLCQLSYLILLAKLI